MNLRPAKPGPPAPWWTRAARFVVAVRTRLRDVLLPSRPEAATRRAADLLASALAEDDPARRLVRLRAALAAGEALADAAGDVVVMEASLHLGEKLRAAGQTQEAAGHFLRAVSRSFRVPDPIGRQRRAGALTRLGILEQESGEPHRARERYEQALAIGADADSALLLGMLTQAAFNLGVIESDRGDDDAACQTWRRAVELGARTGDPSGWDPAAVAAFNLGHLHTRRGEIPQARAALDQVRKIAGPSRTPLGMMAAAKAALALATLCEHESLAGELEAGEHYRRGLEFGRACPLPEGRLAAVQCALGLGERALQAGLTPAAIGFLRDALAIGAGCEPEAAERFLVLGAMRLGHALAASGMREAALAPLGEALARGRGSDAEDVRELAAQSACSLHRLLCALERWAEAAQLAADTEEFTRGLGSPTGRALAAAAAYARAFGELHGGDSASARESLREVVGAGFASGSPAGERVALDALMLGGHLDRRHGRREEALAQFRTALEKLRDHDSPETGALEAMAGVNAGHCLIALERAFEARKAYERALARGRSSGSPTGRAAAANAALNLASLLEDEVPEPERRELYGVAIALGRSSRTPLGEECARTAERGIAAMDNGA